MTENIIPSSNLKRIAAVITAAGLSSRMGDFKPMMKIGSVSIAQRIIATFRHAGCDPIVIVTGFRGDELQKHLSKQNVVFLENRDYDTTQMFDSAKIAFEWLLGKCDALFFTPVDIPLFTSSTLDQLLNADQPSAVPVCEDKTGHPLYLQAALLPQILNYPGEGGLQQALEEIGAKPARVEVEDQGVLYDADTQEEYQKLVDFHNKQLMRPEVRITLTRETPFFGPGTAMLLTLIQQTQSVSSASQQMGISYSKCWHMIRNLEAEVGFTVVQREAGGAGGGYSDISEKGLELMKRYAKFVGRSEEAVLRFYREEFSRFWEGQENE